LRAFNFFLVLSAGSGKAEAMPRYTHPQHLQKFFEQHSISMSPKPTVIQRGIESAETLGFKHNTNNGGDIVVITPLQRRKVYRGFGKTRYQLCAVLMHAMFSSGLH
jgi:hypothetical protein